MTSPQRHYPERLNNEENPNDLSKKLDTAHTNERFNRDIREYFPKGTNFTHVTDQEVEQAQNELNDRARVVLHGMTPREKLAQQLNDAMTA